MEAEQLASVLVGRTTTSSSADAEGRTVLGLLDGAAIHIRNTSLVGTAGITGGKIAAIQRVEGKFTIVFSNGHDIEFPVVPGSGGVLVHDRDGSVLYQD